MINEIQRLIALLAEGHHLDREQATRAFQIMMSGGATPAQIAALLMGLRMNGETTEEITGAAHAMRAKMETISAPENAIDVCGTGGDGKNTLNVSTAVAIVVAACGVPVVKHGNKSVSSNSGSADVLTALGVNIQADKAKMEKALAEANICFLFAPLYHKAMRHVAPVRQELGFRTLFNLLGPLANPAKPKRQLMGVYDKALLDPMAKVLQSLGTERAWVVHGSDGMDELTLAGVTHIAELNGETITRREVTPQEAGFSEFEPDQLLGKNPQSNARELSLLLHNKKSSYRDIVVLNAAAALLVADKVTTLADGVAVAQAVLESGKAQTTLAQFVLITNEA